MMRHTILSAVILRLSVGMFPSVCPGGPSEETVSAPAAAKAVVDTSEAAEPISEKVDLATAGEGKTITDGEDANRPATIASVAFDPNADPNLVAWWKLDGDTADSSGHGLDGQPMGDPGWVEGRIGGAVELDGVDDYIDCGSPPRLAIRSRLTVACWVKVEAFTRPWETVLAKGDSSYRLSRARGMSRMPHFACAGTEPEPQWLNGKTILTDNRWHHIAGVYDGAGMILYVDGRENARKPASGQVAATEHALCIGENIESPGRFLRGLVDDVRIYDRALGPEEIATLAGPYVEAGAGEDRDVDQEVVSREPQGVSLKARKSHTVTLLLAAGMVVLAATLVVCGIAPGRREQGQQEKIVWQIVRKELLLNLMTFKFAAATVACVVLTALFVPILAKDYQERLRTYRDNVTRNEADLRKVKVYKNITPTMFREPSVLSVFSEGLEKQIADAAVVELDKVPEIRGVASQGNPYQSVFPVFDTSMIFKIVLSILALLVAYDAVSGERERGTLKLMLSSATRRHQVLLGKLLAGLLVLVVPVTITFLVGLVILLSFPMISLSASDWGRITLMYIASLIFVSAMYNLGLLFSCLAKRSAISLVLALFLWILFAVVVPNGGVYLATELEPPEPQEKMDAQMALLEQQYDIESQTEFDEKSTRRSPSNTLQDDVGDSFGQGFSRLLNWTYLEYEQERNRLRFPLKVNYADRYWEARHSYLGSLYEQKRLADRLSRISPLSLYDGAMSALAGTDLGAFQCFVDSVRAYRAQIVEYVRSKTDNFSSSLFFTPCTKEEAEYVERYLERREASPEERQAAEAVYREWHKRRPTPDNLDLRDFPVFRPPVAPGTIARAVPDLALLIFADMLFFALSFVAFMRYDVR